VRVGPAAESHPRGRVPDRDGEPKQDQPDRRNGKEQQRPRPRVRAAAPRRRAVAERVGGGRRPPVPRRPVLREERERVSTVVAAHGGRRRRAVAVVVVVGVSVVCGVPVGGGRDGVGEQGRGEGGGGRACRGHGGRGWRSTETAAGREGEGEGEERRAMDGRELWLLSKQSDRRQQGRETVFCLWSSFRFCLLAPCLQFRGSFIGNFRNGFVFTGHIIPFKKNVHVSPCVGICRYFFLKFF